MKRSVLMGIVIVLLFGVSVWMVLKYNKNTRTSSARSGVQDGQAGGDPSAMRERRDQFRTEHESTFRLTRLVENIGRLDTEGKHPLTKQQAKDTLAILTPLRTQEKLTQDDAKETIRALQKVLTIDQRTEISQMPEQRWGGGGQGGPGGPGGARPGGGNVSPGGQRPSFDPAAMKNFNPLNPSSGMGGRGAAHMDNFFQTLEAKAK